MLFSVECNIRAESEQAAMMSLVKVGCENINLDNEQLEDDLGHADYGDIKQESD
jgi:hypothetical protein